MAFVGLLLLAVSLDCARKCKPVNYEYRHFGYNKEYGPLSAANKTQYITDYTAGCKKGCFSLSTTASDYKIVGNPTEDDYHIEQVTCHDCGDIKNGYSYQVGNTNTLVDTDPKAEDLCNRQKTCQWRSGKCRFISCPALVRKQKCMERGRIIKNNVSYSNGWRDGKCAFSDIGGDCEDNCDVGHPNSEKSRTWCKYFCTHSDYDTQECIPSMNMDTGGSGELYSVTTKCPDQRYRYEYTETDRKIAHRVYGCLYAKKNPLHVSQWSIWAFVVTLVILILFAVVVIAGCAFLVFGGGDTKKE